MRFEGKSKGDKSIFPVRAWPMFSAEKRHDCEGGAWGRRACHTLVFCVFLLNLPESACEDGNIFSFAFPSMLEAFLR